LRNSHILWKLDENHPEQQLELEPESIVAELEPDSILVVELKPDSIVVEVEQDSIIIVELEPDLLVGTMVLSSVLLMRNRDSVQSCLVSFCTVF
jgi:adenylate kinase